MVVKLVKSNPFEYLRYRWQQQYWVVIAKLFLIVLFWKWYDLCKFKFTGKMPVQRDWLIILLSGQETLSIISFNSFDDILPYPELDLGLNWPIILAISVGLVYWNKNELEQGVLRYKSKGALFTVLIERARSGPMLAKYSWNLLAMFWAPDTCSFSHRKYAGM